MSETAFIQVIIPLKLDWEPYYELPGAAVGDRVELVFARRHYVGVVSAVNVMPEAGLNVLRAAPSELPPVNASEIDFWRSLASYYLCTVGEVYKVAYPIRQIESEKITSRRLKEIDATPSLPETSLSEEQKTAVEGILNGFRAGKTVLVDAPSGSDGIYLELARRTLSQGKNVLCLRPEMGMGSLPGFIRYDSSCSIALRREIAEAVRSGKPYCIQGTRTALFLPHRNLGLIIVQEEQDSSYKQDSPAPRLHAREAAILLSLVHRAPVLLASSTPSLESLYNVERGIFKCVHLKKYFCKETLFVDLSAETRKKGMKGNFSIKLLEAVSEALEQGGKVLLVSSYKAAQEENLTQLRSFFPDTSGKRFVSATPASFKSLKERSFALVAVLLADGLLGKESFRSDERSLQILQQLQLRAGRLVIQTREPGHPVFKALQEGQNALVFLPERQAALYPPVTRLVDVCLLDSKEKRLTFLSEQLSRAIGPCLGPFAPQGRPDLRVLRVTLPRDKSFNARKTQLARVVSSFEKEYKYIGHIHLDVDPL